MTSKKQVLFEMTFAEVISLLLIIIGGLEMADVQEERSKVIHEINQTYFAGIMPPSWYLEIDRWFDKYGFESDLMLKIFKECNERKALSKNYILKVMESCYESGVKTEKEYEIYQKNRKASKNKYQPNFTDKEMKLIYHAMLELDKVESLHYVESDELELSQLVRKKIEKLIF